MSKYRYRQAEYPAAKCPVRYTAGSHLSTNYAPVGLQSLAVSLPLGYGVSSEFSVRRHVSLGVWKGDIAVHVQHHAGASESSQTFGKEAGQCSC
jgi:hypothetical protein